MASKRAVANDASAPSVEPEQDKPTSDSNSDSDIGHSSNDDSDSSEEAEEDSVDDEEDFLGDDDRNDDLGEFG